MFKKKSLYFLLILTLILGSTLTGCGDKPKDTATSPENSTNNEEVEEANDEELEQVLNMPLGAEPDSLDIAKSSDAYSAAVVEQVVDALTSIEVDENDEKVIKPAMAESWETSDDQLEWTFKIRDAQWSDGEEVTAHNFAYGMKRIIDPETASPISTNLKFIKNAQAIIDGEMDISEVGIEASDDKTLKITLEYPSPYLLELASTRTMQPVREDIVEEYGTSYGTEGDKIIFCGPFVIDEWVHNSKVSLSKNENYWDKDSVILEKVNMKIISETNAQMGELENGELDYSEVNSAEWIEKLDQDDKYIKKTGFLPRTMYLFFNQEIELFSNAKVRTAFNLAIDREEIQHSLLQDIDKAAYGWVAPPIDVNDTNFRELAGDPIKEMIDENPDPKALLIEGLKELGMDEDPSKITVTIMQPGTEDKEFGEYLQQVYFDTLGVNIELDPVEWPVFQERNRQLDYEMGYKSYGGGVNDPSSMLDLWITGTMTVPTGWSNPEYDELVREANKSIDPELRKENFVKAENILLKEDSVIAPYAYMTTNTYMHKHLKGVMEPDFGSMVIKYAYIEK